MTSPRKVRQKTQIVRGILGRTLWQLSLHRLAIPFVEVGSVAPKERVEDDQDGVCALARKEGRSAMEISDPVRVDDQWLISSVSPQMRVVNEMIDQAAATDATVLVWGESGVGKELVAQTLHQRSNRRMARFVKVNCAALPLELLESELFGYERGAFTGAHRPKPGKYDLADKGTMHLDEIGELPLPLQAKLLHVLQDGQFSRLGSRTDTRVDVRVVAATNKQLPRLVEQGQFREDLYYRLNVVNIRVPALRERIEEIPSLVDHFLAVYSAQYGRPLRTLSSKTMHRFMQYAWPGNIRELENLVKRIVVLGSEHVAFEDSDGSHAKPSNGSTQSLQPVTVSPSPMGDISDMGEVPAMPELGLKEIGRRAARDAERRALELALQRVHWNRGKAARRLKISYTALLYKIKQYALDE
jgi:two-component system, NtrC family, response regulator AtoC